MGSITRQTQAEDKMLQDNELQTSDVGTRDAAVKDNSGAPVATEAANTTAEPEIGTGDPAATVRNSIDLSFNQPVQTGDVGPEEAVNSSMTGAGEKDDLNAHDGTAGGGGEESERDGRLPVDGLMAAISGHWRVAEHHFEDTVRRVRIQHAISAPAQSTI